MEILMFLFLQVSGGDTVDNITSVVYQNLTTTSAIVEASSLSNANSITSGSYLQIPINCSCGDPTVSSDYGLFLTYVVAAGKAGNVSGIASDYNTTQELLKQYNPNVVWDNSQPNQIAFIPVTGIYPDVHQAYCRVQIILAILINASSLLLEP
jgi:chitin elicitor receptor kinase 1